MKETEFETLRTEPETDAALAQMAEDVPPMPADFHDRWMNAIRAEAENTASPVEEKSHKNTVSITRWTRILSIAATFVFLIGGTLLYRSSKSPLTAARSAEKKAAVMAAEVQESRGTVEEIPAEGAAPDEYAAEDAEMDADADFMLFAGASKDASAATNAVMAVSAAGTFDEAMTMGESAEEEAAEYAAGESVPAAAMEAATEIKGESFSETADAAEEPEPAPVSTACPTGPVPEQQETADEPTEAFAEGSGLLGDAGAFLTDMGDFLLAALPYLAVLAVPAVIALIIRRRKKS
ncbi:MAG: hypothetical protein IKS46_03075 [Clostridia bacterium]|nr:hypothetical protein [Clostridia bacterium]